MGGSTRTRRHNLTMADTETLTRTDQSVMSDVPWNVVVHDDPVNWHHYVVMVFMKVFSYDEKHATRLADHVHTLDRAIVWTGDREKAELYVQQLQMHQLRTTLEKSS
jgi:ATP-dependent Clp protease adaptor protein ClpS